MSHPVSSQKVNLIAYTIVWALLGFIQAGIFIYIFNIDTGPAIVDSFVVSLIHGILGLAVWYPVRFSPLNTENFFIPLFNIVITGFLAVFVWVGISYMILSNLFSEHDDYLQFLSSSLPGRAITDMLIYAVLVLVYSLVTYNLNLQEKISNESNLKTLVREAELAMLKTQINPHFLFNSLNSISLLISRDQEKAREMIIKLSDFLRYSLRFGEKDQIRLLDELENMDRYLEIEKIRFGDKLLYNKNVEDFSHDFPIPNMILQPLFENAVKHGVYESLNPIHIQLNVKKVRNSLLIEVKNDYDSESISVKGTGIGLKNIKERLLLLYGRSDLINYSGKDGVFIVNLIIPEINI